jgi:shikimate dehydrogenase
MMEQGRRRLCASINAATATEALRVAGELPAGVEWVELRADLLEPGEAEAGRWRTLPGAAGREWIFTWRSPREGGARPRPRGVLRAAVEAGFAAVDVEAADLAAGEAEATAVPVEKRWVSRHRLDPVEGPEALVADWASLRRHPAALHKLVAAADRFQVNDWILDLVRETGAAPAVPFTIFAAGWIGHPSRILGALEGNAVTYVAGMAGAPTASGQPTAVEAVEVYRLHRLPPDPRVFGVLGNPVHRSRSPRIHNHVYERTGERALYLPLESVDADPVLAWVRTGRLRGLSVTAPFKTLAARRVDRLEPAAERVGAVNTVWNEDGVLWGANTDLEAAEEILAELAPGPEGKVAVLGAGGAAAAVLGALAGRRRAAVVFNRDPARGREVAARFGAGFGGPPQRLLPADFAVVVNATPMGSSAPLAPALAAADWSGTAIVDLAYGETPSAFEGLAGTHRVPYRGGLEFLARQASGQVRRWMRRRVDPTVFAEGIAR